MKIEIVRKWFTYGRVSVAIFSALRGYSDSFCLAWSWFMTPNFILCFGLLRETRCLWKFWRKLFSWNKFLWLVVCENVSSFLADFLLFRQNQLGSCRISLKISSNHLDYSWIFFLTVVVNFNPLTIISYRNSLRLNV